MSAELNYLRGRCTGIPECCIEFFVGPWLDAFDNMFKDARARELYDGHQKAMRKYLPTHTRALGVGYVPCPKCLASKTFVQARRCKRSTCFCGQTGTTYDLTAPPRRITVVVSGGVPTMFEPVAARRSR